MRLALVIPQVVSYRIFLSGLANRALEQGWEVSVYTDTGGESANETGVVIVHTPIPRGASVSGSLKAAASLKRHWNRKRPDLVHAHFSAAILCCALAGVHRLGIATWATFQGLGYPLRGGLMGKILSQVEPRSARAFTRIEVLSDDDRQNLGSLLAHRTIHRQQGYGFGCEDRYIDTPLLTPVQKTELRYKLCATAKSPVLLYMGRLVQFKGFDIAVKAFWNFKQKKQNGTLLIVGERDPIHPSGLSEAEWACVASDPSIIVAGWQADPLPWLDCSDYLLFFSEREGMPVSVMEALSRHLPVIGYMGRGTRDLIDDTVTGLLTSSRDPVTLAQLMEKIIATPNVWDFSQCDKFRRSHWIKYTAETYATLITDIQRK